MGSTEMACEPPLMAQDQWLSNFLTSGPTYTLDGDTLTLTQVTSSSPWSIARSPSPISR